MSRAAIVKALLRLFSLLPLRLNHALGAALGRLWLWLPTRLRRVAETNLALCFPELDRAQRRQLLRRTLAETGRTFTEFGPMWHWPKERLLGLAVEVSGFEQVEAAMAAGRGVLMTTPHMGCWEMGGLYCAEHWPMTTMYRPPKIAGLEGLMREARERSGATLVATDAAGVRALYQALARGEMVGLLPDQEPGAGQGRFAPFFGIPAYTMVLLARLAQRNGSAVFIGYAERLSRGRGYHLHFIPAPAGIETAPLEQALELMNRGVERCARERPEQYQWTYKRFRTRPEGEPSLY